MFDIDELAGTIALYGMSAVESELSELARFARSRGLSGVAAEVMADTGAPGVARLRAFARIARELDAVPADRELIAS